MSHSSARTLRCALRLIDGPWPGLRAAGPAADAGRPQPGPRREGPRRDDQEGEQVTFRGLTSRAGVPLDFLYRNAANPRSHRAPPPGPNPPIPAGKQPPAWCTLTAQLSDLKRRHREETAELRQALEQAQGENLLLRRSLGAGGQAEPGE